MIGLTYLLFFILYIVLWRWVVKRTRAWAKRSNRNPRHWAIAAHAGMASLGHLLGVALEGADNERENLYEQLAKLRKADGFTKRVDKLKFVPTLSLVAQSGSDSTEGLAYRYALEQLNPFAVVGAADLYAPHNANSMLDADRFSEEYLADLAHMLSQLLNRNLIDGTLIGSVREYETRLAA